MCGFSDDFHLSSIYLLALNPLVRELGWQKQVKDITGSLQLVTPPGDGHSSTDPWAIVLFVSSRCYKAGLFTYSTAFPNPERVEKRSPKHCLFTIWTWQLSGYCSLNKKKCKKLNLGTWNVCTLQDSNSALEWKTALVYLELSHWNPFCRLIITWGSGKRLCIFLVW